MKGFVLYICILRTSQYCCQTTKSRYCTEAVSNSVYIVANERALPLRFASENFTCGENFRQIVVNELVCHCICWLIISGEKWREMSPEMCTWSRRRWCMWGVIVYRRWVVCGFCFRPWLNGGLLLGEERTVEDTCMYKCICVRNVCGFWGSFYVMLDVEGQEGWRLVEFQIFVSSIESFGSGALLQLQKISCRRLCVIRVGL